MKGSSVRVSGMEHPGHPKSKSILDTQSTNPLTQLPMLTSLSHISHIVDKISSTSYTWHIKNLTLHSEFNFHLTFSDFGTSFTRYDLSTILVISWGGYWMWPKFERTMSSDTGFALFSGWAFDIFPARTEITSANITRSHWWHLKPDFVLLWWFNPDNIRR